MGMVWILLGTLIVAASFFVLAFTQTMAVEARLRKLVVATESRMARVYGLKLRLPGQKPPAESGAAEEPDAAASTEQEEE